MSAQLHTASGRLILVPTRYVHPDQNAALKSSEFSWVVGVDEKELDAALGPASDAAEDDDSDSDYIDED